MDTVKFKVVADWIITARCPLRCEHCIVGELVANASDRMGDELTTQECKDLIDYLFDHGTRVLSITGGEALTRKDLFEIIGYGREKGMKVCLYTTGLTFINSQTRELRTEHVRMVLSNTDFLGISLDTFHDDASKQIRVMDYCETLVRQLFEFASKEFPELQIQLFTVLGKRNGTSSISMTVTECRHIANVISEISEDVGVPIRWRLSPFRYNPGSMLPFQRRFLFTSTEMEELIARLQYVLGDNPAFTMHFGVDYDSFFVYPDGKLRTVRLDESGIDRFIEIGNFRTRRLERLDVWEALYRSDGETAMKMKRIDLLPLHKEVENG